MEVSLDEQLGTQTECLQEQAGVMVHCLAFHRLLSSGKRQGEGKGRDVMAGYPGFVKRALP